MGTGAPARLYMGGIKITRQKSGRHEEHWDIGTGAPIQLYMVCIETTRQGTGYMRNHWTYELWPQ